MKRRITLGLAFVGGIVLAWVLLWLWAEERNGRFDAQGDYE